MRHPSPMMRMRRATMRGVNVVARRFGLSILRTSFLDQLLSARAGAGTPTPDRWAHPGASSMIVDTDWLRDLNAEYRTHPLSRLGGHWDSEYTSELVLSEF